MLGIHQWWPGLGRDSRCFCQPHARCGGGHSRSPRCAILIPPLPRAPSLVLPCRRVYWGVCLLLCPSWAPSSMDPKLPPGTFPSPWPPPLAAVKSAHNPRAALPLMLGRRWQVGEQAAGGGADTSGPGCRGPGNRRGSLPTQGSCRMSLSAQQGMVVGGRAEARHGVLASLAPHTRSVTCSPAR